MKLRKTNAMKRNFANTAQRGMRLSVMAAGMLSAASLAACAAPTSAKPVQRMPRGSYLRKPVGSTTQLVQQFANDPTVVERYSRVFQMSPDSVRSALGTMRLTRLKKDMVMNVYYVRPGEHLGYRVRRVKKGTEVFILPDGTPALVKACGNPLRHTLPHQKITKVPDFNPDEALPTETLEAQPLPEQAGLTRMASSVATAPPMNSAMPPSELEAETEVAIVTGGGPASGDFFEDIAALPLGFLAAGSGGSVAGGALAAGLTKGLLIAGGAAAIGSFVTNSGGSSGGSTPTNPTNPTNPTPPGGGTPPGGAPPPPGLVPEWNPTALLLFGIAGASIPACLRRRKGQQTG